MRYYKMASYIGRCKSDIWDTADNENNAIDMLTLYKAISIY